MKDIPKKNAPSKLSLILTILKSSITHLGLVLTLLFSLTIILIFTYFTTYQSAKEQILDVGGEMFTKVVKDVIGFMEMMDARVKAGEITLAEAQDLVRTYVNGPKKPDGNRDISKSKMSVDDYMYVWASSYKHDRGTLTMHPFNVEGVNEWNYQVKGRYTIRESWSNINNTGRVFRQLWKNPGEPVYTFIAYQEYFEPWDWIVGCGGREEIIYERRLGGLKGKFLIVGAIFLLISTIHVYSFTRVEIARREREEEVRKLNKELEQRVKERTAQLEATNKELDAFAYSVSHDLRAPLRAIDGFSAALLEDYRDKLDDEGRKYLRYVQEGSHEMSDLIDGLLKLSRSTRGGIAPERVDLSAMAVMVAEELRKAEPDRRVTIHIAPGVEAFADHRLLWVVMENLLGNAWKYTSQRADGRIELGVAEQQGKDVYFVRDNGAGFDMAYADKLFLPFQRLHKTSEFPGIGIGLATVERIIHRHDGRIWAQAAVGEGATFYFTLGLERNDDEKSNYSLGGGQSQG
ncbi:cache domain-containing protein [Geotalea uraniireducens]|uniref:histidine kinase n=1 Tax=Geotalea uraniireducens (strain Rf4) TaxID=351605 RepID=A5G9N9_GEOUR|nr:cache domain-containing protein [Geotalea uraniireducens]ABQ28507.1 integral membrane sensor signal transduction histidine kinase [Geotalea uraniireducens Rf4]